MYTPDTMLLLGSMVTMVSDWLATCSEEDGSVLNLLYTDYNTSSGLLAAVAPMLTEIRLSLYVA